MGNLFTSVLVALGLSLGVTWNAAAQTMSGKSPARGAVAAETTGGAAKSEQASAPVTPAPSSATTTADDDQANIVLFTGTIKQDKLKALPGATVYVRSTKQMAVADENGDFSLELDFSNGPVDLNVSYAGFEDQSVSIADPNLFLVVSMNPRKKK